ncbi:hypothetical protein FLL57_18650 [Rhodopseudomonas palustris]|uniref:Uncharacterized protein n=1 Tax=Rhodopseudomonas palustris (strain DX-1) TaxID=652103 RepID=E6VFW7_RHOPX|nr:hypothetical protein [Rhodopseudomonas palustris]QDL99200.1 hypothetical protein FLL57_18650 [Rhodopseudomonas palustris]
MLHVEKTSATLQELRIRVARALQRNPLCRDVRFEIVATPRTRKGGNWTISIQSVAPDALWEASEIIADIQEAYELAEIQMYAAA